MIGVMEFGVFNSNKKDQIFMCTYLMIMCSIKKPTNHLVANLIRELAASLSLINF